MGRCSPSDPIPYLTSTTVPPIPGLKSRLTISVVPLALLSVVNEKNELRTPNDDLRTRIPFDILKSVFHAFGGQADIRCSIKNPKTFAPTSPAPPCLLLPGLKSRLNTSVVPMALLFNVQTLNK